MKKRAFEKFINLSIKNGKKEKIIYDNGLDLINFMDEHFKINSILLESIYGEDVSNIISDFITDNIYGELEEHKNNYLIYKDNEVIADCSTLDGLYNFAEEERLELIKSGYQYDIKEPITDEERLEMIKKIFEK